MAKISLVNIQKSFGVHKVISNLNLEVDDGEFVVLVGPSGCGKTTTLNMIAGLESITAGSLLIGDQNVTHLPPKNRNIAMVFQSYALFPHLNVYENVAFGMKIRHSPKEEIAKEAKRGHGGRSSTRTYSNSPAVGSSDRPIHDRCRPAARP